MIFKGLLNSSALLFSGLFILTTGANIDCKAISIRDPQSKQVVYREKYVNKTYRYSVRLPNGKMGLGHFPSAPDHGIKVIISKHPESYIWTDGSYNSLLRKNLDEIIDDYIQYLLKSNLKIQILQKTNTKLGYLSAKRIKIHYQLFNSEEFFIEDIVMALRETDDPVGIIYQIGIVVDESYYDQKVTVFEKFINSWRTW